MLWQPVYTIDGGQPRRTLSDPARPRKTEDHPLMQQRLSTEVPRLTAPSFYITGRQPLRPGAILLAIVAAVGALCMVLYALGQTGHSHFISNNPGVARSANVTS